MAIMSCLNKSNSWGHLDPVGSSIYQNLFLCAQNKRYIFKRAHLSFAAPFPQPKLQLASWLFHKSARKIRNRRKASKHSILKAAETSALVEQLAASVKCYHFKGTTEVVFRVSKPSGSIKCYPFPNNAIIFYWWSLCTTALIMKSIKDAVCLLQRDWSSQCLAGKEINDSNASTPLATVWSYQFSSQLDSSCFSHSVWKKTPQNQKYPKTKTTRKEKKETKQKSSIQQLAMSP